MDEKYSVLAGHWRIMAIEEMGWDKVEVLQVKGLREEQKKRFRFLDNRLGDYAKFDIENILIDFEDEDDEDMMEEFEEMWLFDEEEEESSVEVEFSEELYESHNYVILYFDNDIDWMTAKEKLGIKTVKAKDSKKWYERSGIWRVLDGWKFLEKLTD